MTLASTETQIFDYSNSQLVTLKDGTGRIQNGIFKIIHIIDLGEYERLTNGIEVTIKASVTEKHPLYYYLIHEISQIHNLISKLKPRPLGKRSLDFIGTAFKWIAGTPDHHDLEVINSDIEQLVRNSNRQIIINRQTLDKMNEMIKRNDDLLKFVKSVDSVKMAIVLENKFKLEVIREDLKNIGYALSWAKANIINSFILSSLEIRAIQERINERNIPYENIEEQLEFSDVRVAINGSTIIYILNLPTAKNVTCELIKIRAVKRNNVMNKIDFKEMLNCPFERYGITGKCKKMYGMTICNDDSLVNLRNENCINNLLDYKEPNCTRINAEHIKSYEVLEPGVIFLNDFKDKISTDNKEMQMQGTFIVKFFNTTVKIGNKVFMAREMSTLNPLPAILQPWTSKTNIEEVLSLEMIKNLHINNTQYIETIQQRDLIHATTNTTIISVIMVISIIIIWRLWTSYKTQGSLSPENHLPTPMENSTSEESTRKSKEETEQTGTFEFKGGRVNTFDYSNSEITPPRKYPELFTFSSK